MARTLDETRAAKRAHMAKKRSENPDAVREYQRNWHKRNREHNAARMRAYYERRFFWGRSMKLRGKDRASFKNLASLWKTQHGLCALTGRRLDRSAQLDHILPKARGGGDCITNLQWVCEEANIAKRHLTDEEFTTLCSDVMRWIGERIDQVNEINVSLKGEPP